MGSTQATTALNSNVVKFFEAVKGDDITPGSKQLQWYDDGLGTNWYDKVAGGAFGLGIDQKIKEGYRWLVDNVPTTGDYQIFVLGFSRGAYTARSLVGMIRNVGLLLPVNKSSVGDAYQLYRNRDDGADTPQAMAFRKQYSRDIEIEFLGVWDTVGALGIPLSALEWLNSATYGFHDTELSGIVKNAFHAVAIDEHRIDYQATLWQQLPKRGQKVEQQWFIGAHANIGGGYADCRLSDITLSWMVAKAEEVGLEIDRTKVPAVDDANWLAPVTDSYSDFLNGLYARTHKPYARPVDLGPGDQTMDARVTHRRSSDASYRPANQKFPPLPTGA
jgi:uncharacterized protein (DUF2235 family)